MGTSTHVSASLMRKALALVAKLYGAGRTALVRRGGGSTAAIPIRLRHAVQVQRHQEGEVTWIAQLVAVVVRSVLGRPHGHLVNRCHA
jgi:hypothetical protein